ncbi:hypothetical protein NPIL_336041, partial [Nephila pilipes]
PLKTNNYATKKKGGKEVFRSQLSEQKSNDTLLSDPKESTLGTKLSDDWMTAAVKEAITASDNEPNIAVALDELYALVPGKKRGYSSLNDVVCYIN